MWKNILKSAELKIFLAFFIIYVIFVQWNGWDENTRYFLTRAIVDEGRLEIDTLANQTSDRVLYQGHYYSDKDPGISLLATIPYSIFKFLLQNAYSSSNQIGQVFLKNHVGNATIYDVLNPGKYTLYSMMFVDIFISPLFSALTLVLIYKIIGLFTEKKLTKLLIVITAGLATTIFPYALVFTDNAVATFFALLGFYFLLQKKYKHPNQKKYSFLSGLSFGFATISSIFVIIISALAFAYLINFNEKKKIFLKFFIIGFLLTSSIYLIYNQLAFNTPFIWPLQHLDKSVFIYIKPDLYNTLVYYTSINPYIMWHLTFDPYKGIFFFYPILLLSFYGLYLMRKKMKAEVLLILLIFVFDLSLNSVVRIWWGSGFFGPKYLTYSVPFLLLPLIFVLDKKSNLLKLLFVILVAYSTLVNLSGIRMPAKEINGPDILTVASQYQAKVNSFQILMNPIFDYYFPEFFKTGPHSRILETAFDCDYLIDIRQPLPIYAQNCSIPIIAEGNIKIPENKSLKLCACSQYGGGDGVILNLWIDNNSDSIYIPSNSCINRIWDVPFADNKVHEVKIEPDVYGKCDMEGVLFRDFYFIEENKGADEFPIMSFDFRNSLEKWDSIGNVRYTLNGTELGVGNCNSSSSIQKNILLPTGSRTLTIKSCEDLAGGDGTMIKVYVDNEMNIFNIPSNLCQENVLNIQKFADGKNHTIKIESGIKGICNKEGPKISWIKILN